MFILHHPFLWPPKKMARRPLGHASRLVGTNPRSTAVNRRPTAGQQRPRSNANSADDKTKGDRMHRGVNHILTGLAIAFVLGTLPPVATGAVRWGPGTPSPATGQRPAHTPRTTCHQYCASVGQDPSQRPMLTSARPRFVTVVADASFNWSDAAIGFGAAWGLVLLSLGSVRLLRRAGLRHYRQPV